MAMNTPISVSPAYNAEVFGHKVLQTLIARGNVVFDPLQAYAKAGSYVDVPALGAPADFAIVDITSTSATSATAMAMLSNKAPVIAAQSDNSFNRAQIGQNQVDINGWLAKSGEKAAKKIATDIFYSLQGAVGAMTNASHSLNISGVSSFTVAYMEQLKAKLADEAQSLNTLCMTSAVWQDLSSDLRATYGSLNLSNDLLVAGFVEQVSGMYPLVTDLIPTSGGGHQAIALGQGAIWLGVQMDPTIATAVDPNVPGILEKIGICQLYAIGVKGMSWNTTVPGSVSTLATTGSWAVGYVDAREVKAALCLCNP